MNDDEDVFQDLRLAQQIHMRPGIDEIAIAADTLFEMATRTGAAVAGIDGIGAIAEGNRADAALISLPEIESGFANRPLPDLMLRRAKAAHVKTVVIGGKVLIEDGRWIGIDLGRIRDELSAALDPAKRGSSETVLRVKEAVREHLRRYH